jgi:hypothetical protein
MYLYFVTGGLPWGRSAKLRYSERHSAAAIYKRLIRKPKWIALLRSQ